MLTNDGCYQKLFASRCHFVTYHYCMFTLLFCPDAARFQPKVDANGNCETADKVSLPLLNTYKYCCSHTEDWELTFNVLTLQINQGYLAETQVTSFTTTLPEQQCLLEKGEAYSDQTQCGNNKETLTRTEGCSSSESNGPLQSTMPLHNPYSGLSEPMSLHSHIEPVAPQTSVSTPSSTQPVTTSPHVNVSIIVNIGNGTGETTSVMPTDLMHVDSNLPFGEKEESSSTPQQEAGKQSLMSVQESTTCCAWRLTCTTDF